MNLFSIKPIGLNTGLLIIRFVTGFFIVYHGWEIFDEKTMNDYTQWEAFKNKSSGNVLVYTGKLTELISGVLLMLGLLIQDSNNTNYRNIQLYRIYCRPRKDLV